MKKIIIINGPNLNLLGKREPEIYGTHSFDDFFENLKAKFSDLQLDYFQSNHEGAILDKIHECGFSYQGIIINPGAFTHTSIALADAVSGITSPVIEVHISNTAARESFRKQSYIAGVCKGTITGLGLKGYELAVSYLRS
jgi:3-dehydroquinate dehydratase II